MNTFKTNRKKWYMTSAVILSLSMSSFIYQRPVESGSTDLSSILERMSEPVTTAFSSSRKVNIATKNGAVQVSVERTGNNGQVRAYIPTLTAEGKVCDKCGFESKLIDARFSDNLQLGVEILKAMEVEVADAKSEKEDEAGTVETTEEKKEEKKSILTKIKEECDEGADEDRLTCLKDGLLDAMRANNENTKDKTLTAKAAHEFYKDYIEKEMIRKIYKSRKASSSLLRSSYMNFDDMYDDIPGDPATVMAEALDFIEEFLSETPSRYNAIRQSLFNAQEKIMNIEAQQLNNLNRLAKENSGTETGLRYSQEAMLRTGQMQSLWGNLQQINRDGLYNALDSDHISQLQFDNFSNMFRDLNGRVVTLITNPTSAGFASDISYMQEMQLRLAAQAARSSGTVEVPGGDLSGRTTNFTTALGVSTPGFVPQMSVLPSNALMQQRLGTIRGN